MIEILICRHGSVPVSLNKDGTRNVHEADVPINSIGHREVWSIAEIYAHQIRFTDSLMKSQKVSVEKVISSPSIRSVLSASQFTTYVYSRYRDPMAFHYNEFFAIREWEKKAFNDINPTGISYPLDMRNQRKLAMIQEELLQEITVRQWGILVNDTLSDVLAPSDKYIGYPIELYQENMKESCISLTSLKKLDEFLQMEISSAESLRKSNKSKVARTVLFTHGNTAKAILALITYGSIPEVGNMRIGALDEQFPFARGTGYILRLTNNRKLIQTEKLVPALVPMYIQ